MPNDLTKALDVVPPKEAARIESCGITQIYERLNAGEYETYTDGGKRLITLRSIRARQERLLTAAGVPSDNPSKRKGGPGHPKKKRHTSS